MGLHDRLKTQPNGNGAAPETNVVPGQTAPQPQAAAPADPYAELARLAPYAVTVQIKTEIAPGGGPPIEADLARVVGILRDGGYRGFVALEYEAREDPKTAVPRHLRTLRKLIS